MSCEAEPAWLAAWKRGEQPPQHPEKRPAQRDGGSGQGLQGAQGKPSLVKPTDPAVSGSPFRPHGKALRVHVQRGAFC